MWFIFYKQVIGTGDRIEDATMVQTNGSAALELPSSLQQLLVGVGAGGGLIMVLSTKAII